jgi:hypothetical protein
MSKALTLWIKALRHMVSNSNFMHFRDLLLHFSADDAGLNTVIRQCLDAVGMTAAAQSDQTGDKTIAFPMPRSEVPVPASLPGQRSCSGTVLINCVCSCHQK